MSYHYPHCSSCSNPLAPLNSDAAHQPPSSHLHTTLPPFSLVNTASKDQAISRNIPFHLFLEALNSHTVQPKQSRYTSHGRVCYRSWQLPVKTILTTEPLIKTLAGNECGLWLDATRELKATTPIDQYLGLEGNISIRVKNRPLQLESRY